MLAFPTVPAISGRVAETFYSIQGEGATVGQPAIFVRLQGCSVGCGWCDTKYSWDPVAGREVTLPALLDEVAASRAAGWSSPVASRSSPRSSLR